MFPILNVDEPIRVQGVRFVRDVEEGVESVVVAGMGFGSSNYAVVLGK